MANKMIVQAWGDGPSAWSGEKGSVSLGVQTVDGNLSLDIPLSKKRARELLADLEEAINIAFPSKKD